MGWQGHLQLDYSSKAGRTIALDRHHGPQRVLQRLYPEGDAVCHHVLVHPVSKILHIGRCLAPGHARSHVVAQVVRDIARSDDQEILLR